MIRPEQNFFAYILELNNCMSRLPWSNKKLAGASDMICSPMLYANSSEFLNISIPVRLDLQTRQLPFGRRMREFIGQVARLPMYFSTMLLSLNFSLFMATELDFLKLTSERASGHTTSW